jgi:hypothetical protein
MLLEILAALFKTGVVVSGFVFILVSQDGLKP